MRDFKLETDGISANLDLNGEERTIINNIFLSFIQQGFWWFDRTWRLKLPERMKNTVANENLVRERVKEALRWIIDLGRAIRIDVETERDMAENPNRLKVLVSAWQADGLLVSFNTFVEVY